jgi:hypothetical protein
MTILCDFKSDKDSIKITKRIRGLDQRPREIIFKYPIDQELIEKETKLIAELKQIRTKLINKEKGIDSASITKSKNNPSSKTRPVICWSVLSLFRFSSART